MIAARTLALALCLPGAALADAKVYTCPLTTAGNVAQAELRVYEFESVVHAAFVQLTTDYGDTLPYVFVCNLTCDMAFVDDEFSYQLQFEAALTAGSTVKLTSSSSTDDHEFVDEFTITDCSVQERPSG